MRKIVYIPLIFISINHLFAEEVLFQKETAQAKREISSSEVSSSKVEISKPKEKKHTPAQIFSSEGNLPSHQIPKKPYEKYTGAVEIVPLKAKAEYFDNVKLGDRLVVNFGQRLVAYPGSLIPVAATITAGALQGGQLLGSASMNEVTKRLIVEFSVITTTDGQEYDIKANALAADGSYGIIGEIHSNKLDLFGLDLIFSAIKGYSLATKERGVTAFGHEYDKSNLGNAEKNALAEASSSSVDRIRNEFLKSKEFIISNPDQKALIIVTEKPKRRL